MNETVKWALELVDRVSGPAKRVQDALGRVTKALGGRLEKGLNGFGDKAGKATKSAGKFAGELATKIGPTLLKVGSAAYAASVGFMAMGAGFVFDTLVAKENALNAFRTLLKVPAEAEDVQKHVAKMAGFFGASVKETSSAITGLLAAGFDAQTAMGLFQGALDMKALAGSDPRQLAHVFAQISATGKLTTQDLKEVGITGMVGVGNIKKAIGALKGIDMSGTAGMAKVEKLIESGSISSTEAIQGIGNAIMKLTGGPLGSFAAKAKGSLGGIWETIKNGPELLVNAMDGDKIAGPLKRIGATIAATFDPNTAGGKRLIALLDKLAESAGGFLDSISPEDIVRGIETIVNLVEGTIDVVTNFGGSFAEGLKAMLGPLMTVIRLSDDGTGKTGVMGESFKALGKVLGWLAGVIILGVGTIVAAFALVAFAIVEVIDWFSKVPEAASRLWDKLGELFDDGVAWFDDVIQSFFDFGGNIVDGMWNNLSARWTAMIKKVKGLAELLPDSVKKVLGIASPSKVFAELGFWTAEGFGQGIESNDNATASLKDMVAPPKVTLSSMRSGNAIGGAMTIHLGGLTINGKASPEEAEELGRAAMVGAYKELQRQMEAAALEVGAAGAAA